MHLFFIFQLTVQHLYMLIFQHLCKLHFKWKYFKKRRQHGYMFSDTSGLMYQVPTRPMLRCFDWLWTSLQEQREQYSCISKPDLPQHSVVDPEPALQSKPGKTPAILPKWLSCSLAGQPGCQEHHCFSASASMYLHRHTHSPLQLIPA